ncbi:hypothetical protein QCA50_021011 [Cerrena zonata]|uniref:Methyltransferase small domain-containing protein n=1 Tax=Cerrena zonata TaxID=2478898 RepID=A0AAW0F9H6_9APHY
MFETPLTNIDYDKVYEPAEDSFLLLDCFEQEYQSIQQRFTGRVPVVTEIGTGSGIVTCFIKQNILPHSIFFATDINPTSCSTAAETIKLNDTHETHPFTFTAMQMNLTSAVRSNKIDLLVFNPPYVPAENVPEIPKDLDDSSWLDLALLGGQDGMMTTWEVLNNLENILTPEIGIAYILFCARNKPDQVAETMKARGWKVDVVIHRKAGWEVLSILLFQK